MFILCPTQYPHSTGQPRKNCDEYRTGSSGIVHSPDIVVDNLVNKIKSTLPHCSKCYEYHQAITATFLFHGIT